MDQKIEDVLPSNECAIYTTDDLTRVETVVPDFSKIEGDLPSMIKCFIVAGMRLNNDPAFRAALLADWDAVTSRAT